jgi:hypothetical protein
MLTRLIDRFDRDESLSAKTFRILSPVFCLLNSVFLTSAPT